MVAPEGRKWRGSISRNGNRIFLRMVSVGIVAEKFGDKGFSLMRSASNEVCHTGGNQEGMSGMRLKRLETGGICEWKKSR